MKIGILTFHNADNYGAVLQCYALQETLKKKYPNDKVYVIDYKCAAIINSYIPPIYFKRPWSILKYIKTKRKCKTFEQFRKKHFNLGAPDFSTYDVIYYGSDQIWNPNLTNRDLTYFGKGFNGSKITYAASDGGEMEYGSDVCELLNKFSKISSREKSLTEKLKKCDFNMPVETVCDPVFLLSKEEWFKIADLPKDENYILAYKVSDNPNFDIEAEKLGELLNKKVIQIVYVKSLRKNFCAHQKIVAGISPEQFIGYFAKADFVLTTSFHGTAFSIIFDKQFYVLEFDKRSERITDLLSALRISDNFGREVRKTDSTIQDFDIYKQKSLDFLN